MSDVKPKMSADEALHRAATSLPLNDIKAGMKACVMLQDLVRVCVKAKHDAHVLTPEGLLQWLADNGVEVDHAAT